MNAERKPLSICEPGLQVKNPRRYFVGLHPRMRDMKNPRNWVHTMNALELVREVQRKGAVLTLGDIDANFRADGRANPEKRHKEVSDYQALYWRALCAAQADTDGGAPSPVERVSELISPGLMAATILELKKCLDPEAVYACVPPSVRPWGQTEKKLSELKNENPKAYKQAIARMEYVYTQTASTLILGGVKMGHERERAYDLLAAVSAQKFGLPEPEFEYDGQALPPYLSLASRTDTPASLSANLLLEGFIEGTAPEAHLLLDKAEQQYDLARAVYLEMMAMDPCQSLHVANRWAWDITQSLIRSDFYHDLGEQIWVWQKGKKMPFHDNKKSPFVHRAFAFLFSRCGPFYAGLHDDSQSIHD